MAPMHIPKPEGWPLTMGQKGLLSLASPATELSDPVRLTQGEQEVEGSSKTVIHSLSAQKVEVWLFFPLGHFWEFAEILSQPSANIFCRRPGSDHIGFTGPTVFVMATQLCYGGYVREKVWLCSSKYIFTETGSQPAGRSLPWLVSLAWGGFHTVSPHPGQMEFILWLLTLFSSLWKKESPSRFSSPEGWCFSRGPENKFEDKSLFLLFIMGSPDQVNGKCSCVICPPKKLSSQVPTCNLLHSDIRTELGTFGPYIPQPWVKSKSILSNAGTQVC